MEGIWGVPLSSYNMSCVYKIMSRLTSVDLTTETQQQTQLPPNTLQDEGIQPILLRLCVRW